LQRGHRGIFNLVKYYHPGEIFTKEAVEFSQQI